jgi:hypothetical protein
VGGAQQQWLAHGGREQELECGIHDVQPAVEGAQGDEEAVAGGEGHEILAGGLHCEVGGQPHLGEGQEAGGGASGEEEGATGQENFPDGLKHLLVRAVSAFPCSEPGWVSGDMCDVQVGDARWRDS